MVMVLLTFLTYLNNWNMKVQFLAELNVGRVNILIHTWNVRQSWFGKCVKFAVVCLKHWPKQIEFVTLKL